MKKDFDVPAWLNLSLLDDASSTPVFRRQPAFTLPPAAVPAPHMAVQAAAQRAAKAASNASPLAPKKITPTGRIFRDRPSLREMMSQYNRRSAFSSGRLLKSNTTSAEARAKIVGPEHFAFDRVEAIQLPSIPGKILRPC